MATFNPYDPSNSWIKSIPNAAMQASRMQGNQNQAFGTVNSPTSGKSYQILQGSGGDNWYMASDGRILKGAAELANYDATGGKSEGEQALANFSNQMMGDVGKYGSGVDAFLASQAPQFNAPQYQGPGPNRFEAGLSSSERRLNALLDDPSSIQQTAAYKFRLGQGQEALQRQMAAKGMLGSGNRLMELTKYGQDMASQEYENQYGRLSDLYKTNAGSWNQAQGTNVQEALGKYGTAMQGALGSYGTAMQGHTARGNTLADLYGKAVSGAGQGTSAWAKQSPTQPINTLSTNLDMSRYRSAGFL